jgi:archaellum component FlaC
MSDEAIQTAIENENGQLREMFNKMSAELTEIKQENEGLKKMITRINEKVMPGTADSIDCLKEILDQHEVWKIALESIQRCGDAPSRHMCTTALNVGKD